MSFVPTCNQGYPPRKKISNGELRRALDSGMPASNIASRYGMARSTVYGRIKGIGYSLSDEQRRPLQARISAALADGESTTALIIKRSKGRPSSVAVTLQRMADRGVVERVGRVPCACCGEKAMRWRLLKTVGVKQ